MNIGDDRPRILNDDETTIPREFEIDDAIDAARERWSENQALRIEERTRQLGRLEQHAILKELHARFEADLLVAQARHDRLPSGVTRKALLRARERVQVVMGEHPLDDELHTEHKALAPVIESIERAFSVFDAYEARVARQPSYRWRQGGTSFYSKPDQAYVPGDPRSGATRIDRVLFGRGADPVVALKIAQAVIMAVRPVSPRKNGGQYEDEQINRVLVLMQQHEVKLSDKKVGALLVALGYPANKVKPLNLVDRRRSSAKKGAKFPVSKSARGRQLGRPRAKGI